MPGAGVSGLALAEIGAGLVLAWAGVENVPVSTVLRSVATGKLPPKGPSGQYATSPGTGGGGSGQDISAAPLTAGQQAQATRLAATGTDSANRALGRLLAATYGWGSGADWQALDYGWGTLESGWRNTVYSGGQVGGSYQPGVAYGIPQALGHGPGGAPYPAGNAGNPPGAGGSSSAVAQIRWGLAYIRSAYGHPAAVPGWTGGTGYQGY